MKKLIFFLSFLFICGSSFSQLVTAKGLKFVAPGPTASKYSTNLNSADSLSDQAIPTAKSVVDFFRLKGGSGGSGGIFQNPGPISSLPTIGFNPQATTVEQWILNVFYQSQPPLATLSGAEDLELMVGGSNLTKVLAYSASRQEATATIATINISGANVTFSQPSAPGTVSGNQNVSLVRNTNTTFTNTVTTTDGKIATATTTFRWFPKNYWFYYVGLIPTSTDILNAVGGGSALTSTKSKSNFTINTGATPGRIAYAYPASLGPLTSIVIGGFESFNTFTLTTISLTNASGYTQNYNIYYSQNEYNNYPITINSVN